MPSFDLVIPTQNCERFRCFQGWHRSRSDSERLQEQELWLVWAGKGRMQTRDAEYELRPGFCVWMRPGRVYDAQQDENDRIGLTFIHFNFQDAALNRAHTYPEFFEVGDINYVDSISRRIVEIMRQHDAPEEAKSAAGLLLSGLLLDLVTKFRYEDKSHANPIARHHKELIQKTVRNIFETVEAPLSVKELATKAGYSPAHFSSLFKKVTGQTVEAAIVQARIDKARQLLRQSDLSIGRIAEATGYRDVYFFSRQFKFKTGQTPTKYRAAAQEELGQAKRKAARAVKAAK
ncbi:MAG: AraC family transcriptional regulator [Verrucomicrobiota bacterium]